MKIELQKEEKKKGGCAMNLFDYGNAFVRKSDWKDLAVLKFCLCAMGIMIGCRVPEKYRKPVIAGSAVVFFAAYIPLMYKFFKVAGEEMKQE